MRLSLRSLILSSAALCATAAFAADHARVDVPFTFTAKGHSYPAGMYDVVLDGERCFVTLASREVVSKQISWSVGPAEPANMFAIVKFDQRGAEHELKSIQVGDKVTPDLDRHPKRGIGATVSIGGQ
jgi:catabolite regulation protein CreA